MTNFFTNSDGEELERTTTVEVSTEQRLIPKETTLEVTIIGVDINPEDDYGNNEHIIISTIVTEIGEYSGIECNHKLHINDDKTTKADKAKELLLAYDSNIKGHLFKAASEGKDIIEMGLLNRALNGGIVSATFAEWQMPIKYKDEQTGELVDAIGDDGQPMIRRGNWIKGISPCASKQVKQQKSVDETIKKLAQSQPNTPVVDAINMGTTGAAVDHDSIPF